MNPSMTIPAVFPTPWAARAFALVHAMAQAGWFKLPEFQQALIASIRSHEQAHGCVGDDASYYDCWLEALTSLLRQRGLQQRLEAAEVALRSQPAVRAHAHDEEHHHHDHDPQPLYTERSQ